MLNPRQILGFPPWRDVGFGSKADICSASTDVRFTPNSALLFANIEGILPTPNSMSAAWSDYATSIGMSEVTFHGLRHTHASQLISEGVDIVTISKRLGRAKPDITLRIYSHMFKKDDRKAAAAIDAIFPR